MRLINVRSKTIEFFMGSQVPKYAILSHTWEEEEVTFQDFTNPDETVRSGMKGYHKILQSCELAQSHGLDYVWVDTCCIDKTSSAELTEAINSMFQWYKDAEVCYAWLADLPTEDSATGAESFKLCRWFTRGWTLQELIAPRRVEFYDRSWGFRGTRSELKGVLVEITGIDGEALENPDVLYRIPVAQRMSWAATRQTTRIEDIAYCLLGIFDINMPMLYGEGPRAFLRLQEHLVKETNDLSIFAWTKSEGHQEYHGVFADNVSDFRESSSVQPNSDVAFNPDFTVTNKGLQIETGIMATSEGGGYTMSLNCSRLTKDGERKNIGIYISQHAGGVYSRAKPFEYGPVEAGTQSKPRRIFILKHVSAQQSIDLQTTHQNAFYFRKNFNQQQHAPFLSFPFRAETMTPSQYWDDQRRMFLTHGASDFVAAVQFELREGVQPGHNVFPGQWFIVVFGFQNNDPEPWITIAGMRDEGPDLYGAIRNLATLAARGRKGRARLATTVDGMKLDKDGIPLDLAPVGKISVSMQQDIVNGQPVHCIDLEYQALSTSAGKKANRFLGGLNQS